jgi:signal transduction histidine kinase
MDEAESKQAALRSGPAVTSVRHWTRWIVPLMVVAIAGVAVLAWWDGQRESAVSLDDFTSEQTTLAASVANDLEGRLHAAARAGMVPIDHDARREFSAVDLTTLARIEKPGALMLLVRPPDSSAFFTTSGEMIESPPIAEAFVAGARSVRLTRPESSALGLPERMAMVGLANADGGPMGIWKVAAVATAQRVRDRQRRSSIRLVLAVAIAAGLTLAFGGLALRNQRSEMELSHELELARIARERDERLERLSQAATMLTLASGMAHELSTPLGVIVGRAEQILPRVSGDERATRGVQSILDQAERIREVIRGFLSVARGGSPVLREIEPAEVVKGAAALVEHRFVKAGVRLTFRVPDALPRIRCEPRLLEHALVNLLLNACEACAKDGQVVVELQPHAGMVEFAVVDEGAGIDEAIAARVLEPFFTTKATGTGLGLAVANEIVKTHRGTLGITPLRPKGTRVAFQVPVSGMEAVVSAGSPATAEAAGGLS